MWQRKITPTFSMSNHAEEKMRLNFIKNGISVGESRQIFSKISLIEESWSAEIKQPAIKPSSQKAFTYI